MWGNEAERGSWEGRSLRSWHDGFEKRGQYVVCSCELGLKIDDRGDIS